MAARRKEDKFSAVVLKNRKKLPITIQATEGFYNREHEISNGDIMRVLAVEDSIFGEFKHPDSGDIVKAQLPLHHTGGFETVLRHGPNHIYRVMAEVARDFPLSVRVLEDVQIRGMLVKRGEGLKLGYVKKTTDGYCIVCTHVPSTAQLLVPYSTKGRFSPRRDDGIYTIEELQNRMPVLVKRESNLGRRLRDANSHSIPGVPDDFDGTMLLTSNTMVTVDHWDDPGSLGIYDVTVKRTMTLPIDFDITVVQADGIVAQYGSSENLFEVARAAIPEGDPVLAVLSSGQRGLDYLNLAKDVVLVIHRVETRTGFLITGRSSRLLVPKDYKNTTRFKILGREYITPYDLWKSQYMGPVKATLTGRAPEGFPESRSIYKNDEVCLTSKPTQNEELCKLVGSNGDEEEIDVVHLERILSTTSTVLGSIYVASYLMVHFREAPPSLGEHPLCDVAKYGKPPMTVELSTITGGASMTKDDNNLLHEGPLRIEAECEYSVAYVTIYDPYSVSIDVQEAQEIPDFLGIHVRPIRETNSVKVDDIKYFRKPIPRVFDLTLKQYSELYEPFAMDENDYEPIKEKKHSRGQYPPLPPKSPAPDGLSCRLPSGIHPRHNERYQDHTEESHHDIQSQVAETHRRGPEVLPKPTHGSRLSWLVSEDGVVGNKMPPTPTNVPVISNQLRNRQVVNENNDGYTHSRPVSELTASGLGEAFDKSTHVRSRTHNSVTRKPKKMVPTPTQDSVESGQRCVRQADNAARGYTQLQPVSELAASGLGEAFDNSALSRSRYTPLSAGQDENSTYQSTYSSESRYEKPSTYAPSPDQDIIPKYPAPSDGNIFNFDTLQLAGMLRQLDFSTDTVQKCIQKQINGTKLCDMARTMVDEQLKKELGVTNDSHFYALKHFVSKSEIATTVPKVEPPGDGKIHQYDVRQIAGLLRYFEFTDQAVSNCLVNQIDGRALCGMALKMSDDALKKKLKLDTVSDREFFALKYFISVSTNEINNN